MRWYLFALVIAAAGCSMAPWYYATQNEHVLSLGGLPQVEKRNRAAWQLGDAITALNRTAMAVIEDL